MFDCEDVAVEGRDPSLTLHRHVEISKRVADVALDLIPIELRIMVDEIGGAIVTELLVNADFGEFVIKRIELTRVERIAQLADEICGPDQTRFGIGRGVVFILRHREAGQLDGCGNVLLIMYGTAAKRSRTMILPRST